MKRRRKSLVDDVPALLGALGIEYHRAGSELRCHCPNPDHPKKPGPGSVQIVPQGEFAGYWKCYAACGAGGGPIALVRMVLACDGKEARRFLREFTKTGVPTRVRSTWPTKTLPPRQVLRFPLGGIPVFPLRAKACEDGLAFLLSRGLTEEEVDRWQIHVVPPDAPAYKSRVIVPIVVNGEMVDFVARLYVKADPIVPKALSGRKSEGARKELSLWGYDELDPDISRVHVVEGVWGAVSMLHNDVPNVTAACGSSWSQERTELLAGWDEIVLIPDGDPAGSHFEKLASSLRFEHTVSVVDLPVKTQPDHHGAKIHDFLNRARPFRPTQSIIPGVRLLDPNKM